MIKENDNEDLTSRDRPAVVNTLLTKIMMISLITVSILLFSIDVSLSNIHAQQGGDATSGPVTGGSATGQGSIGGSAKSGPVTGGSATGQGSIGGDATSGPVTGGNSISNNTSIPPESPFG